MWNTPAAKGAEECKEFAFQGVAVNTLEHAVLEGWTPVKKDDKVGTNWPLGPQGIRQYGEQILCKMPRAQWDKLQKAIDDYNSDVLDTSHMDDEWHREVDTAEGHITNR